MSTWARNRHEATKRDADRQRQIKAQQDLTERRARLREAFEAHKTAMEDRFSATATTDYDARTNVVTWACAGHVIGTAKMAGVPVDHKIITPEE